MLVPAIKNVIISWLFEPPSSLTEGMKELARLAKKHGSEYHYGDFSRLGVWDDIEQFAWEEYAGIVAGWFREGMDQFHAGPELNFLGIVWGDVMEVFHMWAGKHPNGQRDTDEMIRCMASGDWTRVEEMMRSSLDEGGDLCYHRIDELPHRIWTINSHFNRFSDASYLDDSGGDQVLWLGLVHATLGRCFQEEGAVDGAKLLPSRAAVPLLLGWNEGQDWAATLTPTGWQRPRLADTNS